MAGPVGPIEVSGRRARALVSSLALHAGEVVAAEQLLSWVWGASPPANPGNALQGQLSKLRRTLRPYALVASGRGYRLDVERDGVDVHRFEQLAAQGRREVADGAAQRAERTLHDALHLWRGQALVDLDHPDLLGIAARLDELRLDTLELSYELRLGSAAAHDLGVLAAELESLVAQHPLREHLWLLRVSALWRAGRQAEALRVCHDVRRVLADQVGLEPGPQLRALEAAVLANELPAGRAVQATGTTVGTAAAVAPDAPAAAASATDQRLDVAGNLPAELNRFIGRRDELAAVGELSVGEHRLVTLVGPGGAGKTRLALAAARELPRAAGCWLVELAPVLAGQDVDATIAVALGALDLNDRDGSDGDALPKVQALIAQRELVLVLDNCEHVIAAAAAATDALLRSCPNLRIVATSREALGVPGERLFPVPPLAEADAVELFTDRAVALRPDFAPDDDERAMIAEVCWRLDGLPLAVELAAARLRSLGLAELSSRLDDRFRLLTGGARSVLPRQQTLRAVVDWSYDLLDEREQRVWQALSVVTGGCSLDTAEALCRDDQVAPHEVMELIDSLIEKSLVVAIHTEHGTRYRLLQTLALYGREKLAASGRAEAVRDRHVAFWAALADQMQAGVQSPDQARWITRLRADTENLRAAVGWAVHRGDVDAALAIAAGSAWFFWLQGDLDGGTELLRTALSIAPEETSVLRARCKAALAWMELFGRGSDASMAAMLEALDLARATQDSATIGFALLLAANHHLHHGDGERMQQTLGEAEPHLRATDFGWGLAASRLLSAMHLGFTGHRDRALTLLEEARQRFRQVGDRWGQGVTLLELADAAEVRGDYDTAVEALEESRMLMAASGGLPYDAFLLARLGNLALLQGRNDQADKLHQTALNAAQHTGMLPDRMMSLISAALGHRVAGRLAEAAELLEEALQLTGREDRPHLFSVAHSGLGFVAELRGQLHEAAHHHQASLEIVLRAHDVRGVALAVEGLGGAVAASGDLERGAFLLGVGHGLRASVGAVMPAGERRLYLDRIEAAVATGLGPAVFAERFERGVRADAFAVAAQLLQEAVLPARPTGG